ncbi:MAG: hypothetical protein PGN13_03730 [Patulibacter minatonensis]
MLATNRPWKTRVVTLVAAGVLSLAGCGGGKEQGAAPKGDAQPTTAASVSPSDRARELVHASYPTTFPLWLARYTEQWGATPDETWTAEQTGGRWVARMVLSVPQGERVETMWDLTQAPEGRGEASPTKPIPPANPSARRFTRFPKASPPRRGPVRLLMTVLEQSKGGKLSVVLETTDGMPLALVLPDGRPDKPLLRGVALLGDAANSGREIDTDSGTHYRDRDGERISRRAFRRLLEDSGPQVSTVVTWSHFPKPGTLGALLREAPSQVELPRS